MNKGHILNIETKIYNILKQQVYNYYEARIRFRVRVRVRYGGTPIPKKLGYRYSGIFFYYIFLYIIIHIFLNICELKLTSFYYKSL